MGNIKINSINYFLLLRVWCHNSSTIVPKSWVSKPLSAMHIKGCAYLCYCLLSSDLRIMRDMSWMHLIYVLMVISVICTCHNKLHCTLKSVDKASNEFTVEFGIVAMVDVLDNQGSSSFNFNSSFVRWRNVQMFLDTKTVIDHHVNKYTIHQNFIKNVLNFIMWISVVPHQLGITTIVKVAWIRRFLDEMHIHTP